MLVPALLAALVTPASAAPLLSSRVGGLSLVGPASRHPASLFYNPATLGFQHGHHLFLDGLATLAQSRVTRGRVDPLTGSPTTGSFPEESSNSWAPQFFAAGISDLGLESLVIGLAVHTPTWERSSYLQGTGTDHFDGAAQTASRYHGAEMTLLQLYVTLGAALRLTEGWYLGFSASYVFGSLDYAFVRDAALDGGATRGAGEYIALDDCGGGQRCNFGNDRAAEAIRVSGTSNGIGFAAGLIGRVHRDVDIGIGYVSAIVGLGGARIPSDGEAWIRRSEAMLENASQLAGVQRDLSGRSLVNYQLPDLVTAGATWRVSPKLTLDFQLRWATYRRHDRLDIRLTGTEFRADPEVPRQIVHYRGFQDMFSGQLGAIWRVAPRLELSAATMIESAAVPSGELTAMAVDGWKLDLLVALRYWVWGGFSVRAGYGLIIVPAVENDAPAFLPSYLPECVDNNFDIDLPACKAAAAGRGLAANAGSYSMLLHRFGVSVAYDWN